MAVFSKENTDEDKRRHRNNAIYHVYRMPEYAFCLALRNLGELTEDIIETRAKLRFVLPLSLGQLALPFCHLKVNRLCLETKIRSSLSSFGRAACSCLVPAASELALGGSRVASVARLNSDASYFARRNDLQGRMVPNARSH